MQLNHEWTPINTNQDAEKTDDGKVGQARIRPTVWWGNNGGTKEFGGTPNTARETRALPF